MACMTVTKITLPDDCAYYPNRLLILDLAQGYVDAGHKIVYNGVEFADTELLDKAFEQFIIDGEYRTAKLIMNLQEKLGQLL